MTNAEKNTKMPFSFNRACAVPISRLKKIVLPLLLILLLGGLSFALMKDNSAPAVEFSTISGQTLQLEKLRGKIVLVNFWATSCPGCVAEMPKLTDTYKQYHAHGFEVIAVAMSYDPPDHVMHFAKKNALPFQVALDADGSLAQAFGSVQVTPTSFVIDQQGNVVQRVMGELDFAALDTLLDQKLRRAS
jgi:peroxiredoxin